MPSKKIYLSVVMLLLALLGSAWYGVHIMQAQAATGAAQVNLGSPLVTGDAVALTGSVASGLLPCGGSGNVGGGPVCNCCPFPPPGPNIHWSTCQIQTVTYNITGPASRSGGTNITSTTNTPGGCSLACVEPNTGFDTCQETKNFSISESGLPDGDYTMTITSNDCEGANVSSQNFTIDTGGTPPPPPGGDCTFDALLTASNPTPNTGETIVLTAQVQNTSNDCSGIGLNRRFAIDTNGDGSYEHQSGWTGCFRPGGSCGGNVSTQVSYPSAGTVTPRTRIEWRNNNNGTVTEFDTVDVTVDNNTSGAVSVNLRVKESTQSSFGEGPIEVDSGDDIVLEWNIFGNANNCEASAAGSDGVWTGSVDASPGVHTQTLTNRTELRTYTIDCDSGVAVDSVTVDVTSGNGSPTCSTIPAPTVNLTVSPNPINSGGSATLSWTVTGSPDTCTASEDWSGDKSTSNNSEPTGALFADKTYTLTCTNACASAEDTVIVDVDTGGPLACSGSPTAVGITEDVLFTATGGTGDFAWSGGDFPISGGNLPTYTTRWFDANNAGNSGIKTVNVTRGASTAQCSATVYEGTITIVSRDVGNSNAAVDTTWQLNGPEPQTQLAASSGRVYSNMEMGTYTIVPDTPDGFTLDSITPAQSQQLTAVTGGTDITFNLNWVADGNGPNAPDVTLTASPNPIDEGATTELTWTTTNSPTSCTGAAFPYADPLWVGSRNVAGGSIDTSTLAANNNYSIFCSNSDGSDSASELVIVNDGGSSGNVAVVLTVAELGSTDYSNSVTIASGGDVELRWTTAGNPTICIASGGWSGEQTPTSGPHYHPELNITSPQTYTLRCERINGEKGVESFAEASATVSLAGPDFTLSNGGGVTMGTSTGSQSGDVMLTVGPLYGFDESVTLVVTNITPILDVTGAFAPGATVGAPYANTTLVFTANSPLTPGAYSVTVEGTSDMTSTQHQTVFDVLVSDTGGGSPNPDDGGRGIFIEI